MIRNDLQNVEMTLLLACQRVCGSKNLGTQGREILLVHTNAVYIVCKIIFEMFVTCLVWNRCVRISVLNTFYYKVLRSIFSIIHWAINWFNTSSSSTKPLKHDLAFENLFTIIDFHLKFDFIYLVQKQNGVLGVTGCVFCVTNCTRVKALAKNDSYFLIDFSKISILLVWVCFKSFEICRINNDLRCMQQVVSMVLQRCLW